MTEKSKISDNESTKKLLDTVKLLDGAKSVYEALPFLEKIFPKLVNTLSSFTQLKDQTSILLLPDKFNELFSTQGWIVYESMSVEVIKNAIHLHETSGLDAADAYLADTYDEDTLSWGIMRFTSHIEFRRRMRLANLAKIDYLERRYHACVPLLLSLLDGIVNDVSKHVSFFASNTNLTAWDCIAAHETGLQSLAELLNKGRNKTSEESITVPYRNGILHGRDLAFDNKIVAAKCWAALFAIRDWASALQDGKKEAPHKKELSWKEIFAKINETNQISKAIENWQARSVSDIPYLPFSGDISKLPSTAPETVIGRFINNWQAKRFGLLSEDLLNYTNPSKGIKAGRAKQDFSKHIPASYIILDVNDETSAISNVLVEFSFEIKSKIITRNLLIRTCYVDAENNFLPRNIENGHWQIVQSSFSEVIYNDNFS